MKHLVYLADLGDGQYEQVQDALRKAGVEFSETPGGVFSSGAIVVAEKDLQAARAALREQSREFAARARREWEEEWKTEHEGSGALWFFHRFRRQPLGTAIQLVLLIFMVGIFVALPIWFIVRPQ